MIGSPMIETCVSAIQSPTSGRSTSDCPSRSSASRSVSRLTPPSMVPSANVAMTRFTASRRSSTGRASVSLTTMVDSGVSGGGGASLGSGGSGGGGVGALASQLVVTRGAMIEVDGGFVDFSWAARRVEKHRRTAKLTTSPGLWPNLTARWVILPKFIRRGTSWGRP